MEQKKSLKSKKIQLVIPEFLYVQIEKKAKEIGINTSEAIRESIREFIRKN